MTLLSPAYRPTIFDHEDRTSGSKTIKQPPQTKTAFVETGCPQDKCDGIVLQERAAGVDGLCSSDTPKNRAKTMRQLKISEPHKSPPMSLTFCPHFITNPYVVSVQLLPHVVDCPSLEWPLVYKRPSRRIRDSRHLLVAWWTGKCCFSTCVATLLWVVCIRLSISSPERHLLYKTRVLDLVTLLTGSLP
jgi:hypothetical protein